ncbi:hypothetical protein [Primorskyibacter sp. 2E233]|uniref:hypothetical protein n=1 Tax=Primorskyibacter sp. 2E233 TaxID=3413431 RepID=UPI003BF44A9C
MSDFVPPTTLAELRHGIQAGTIITGAPVAATAVLDLAAAALGPQRMQDPALLKSEACLTAVFPEQPDEALLDVFGDAAMYKRCRSALVRLCQTAGLWEDPYPLLNAVAKGLGAPGVNRRLLEAHFPSRMPCEITRTLALEVDQELHGAERQQLRRVFRILDAVRADGRVVASGALAPEAIGDMQRLRKGDEVHVALPADVAACVARLKPNHAIRARRAFELAVDEGVLNETTPAERLALTEADARAYHSAVSKRISRSSANTYLHALCALITEANPSGLPEGFKPTDVTCERKTKASKPSKPNPAKPAVLPEGLQNAVTEFARVHRVGRQRVRRLKKTLARTLTDKGMTGVAPPDDLVARFDAAAWDVSRDKHDVDRAMLTAFQKHLLAPCPWDLLLAEARERSIVGVDMRGLALVRALAKEHTPPLAPGQLTAATVPALLHKARQRLQTTRFRLGMQSLDLLRDHLTDRLPGPPIGPLPDGRKHNDRDLPERLERALRDFLNVRGYSEHSVKAQIVAARKLYTCAPDPALFDADLNEIPWIDLLNSAMETHPKQMEIYRTGITRLAEQLANEMSEGWRKLDTLLARTGVSRESNPVARLSQAARVDDLEPWQVHREWAWVHERALRPDLRRAWTRAVNLFDALHTVPAIATAGLLPTSRLGPMPVVGERQKNAEFPLPSGIDTMLCGADKQVHEAAHFTWRCLRHLGVYDRTDTPTCAELFSDENLHRVRNEQSLIGRQTAALHLARIRDWRLGHQLTL